MTDYDKEKLAISEAAYKIGRAKVRQAEIDLALAEATCKALECAYAKDLLWHKWKFKKGDRITIRCEDGPRSYVYDGTEFDGNKYTRPIKVRLVLKSGKVSKVIEAYGLEFFDWIIGDPPEDRE